MKIKVCGLTAIDNINQVSKLEVDYVGFIFYKKTSRFVELTKDLISEIHGLSNQKVGVFVDETQNEVVRLKTLLDLDYVQLHGDESVEYCKELQVFTKIIKVFKIDEEFDFETCKLYDFVDYFLFETKGKLKGGNGTQFDWSRLQEYDLSVPFFLSGGIGMCDVSSLTKLNHPALKVVDVNSGFELEPGLKNVELIKEFKNELSNR